MVRVPERAVQVRAVRASGPGGQNVNKVATKVDVRVDLAAIEGRSAPGSATRAIGGRAGTHADPKAAAQQRRLGDRLAHARLGATNDPLDLDARAALEPAHATTRLTARPVGLGLERLQLLLQRLHLPLEIGHRASLRVLASARQRRRAFTGRSETQRAHLVPEALDVAELDLLVAADQIRQTREL